MRAHTVPRFYLAGFTDPVTPSGHEPSVWFHADPERIWRRRSPLKLTRRPNYYSPTDADGVIRHEPEKALHQVESDTARVLRDVIAKRLPVGPADKAALAKFVGTMLNRVPRLHAELSPLLAENVRDVARAKWEYIQADPERLNEFVRHVVENAGTPINVVETMNAALDPAKFAIKPDEAAVMLSSLDAGFRQAAAFENMGWLILLAREPDCFVTSDWPVSLWHPDRPDSNYLAPLGQFGVQLTFPLSRSSAIFGAWDLVGTKYVEAPTHLVANVNMRSVRLAATIFSPSRSFPGADEIRGMQGQRLGEGGTAESQASSTD